MCFGYFFYEKSFVNKFYLIGITEVWTSNLSLCCSFISLSNGQRESDWHDDIRHSLEVLDSVLAEFDDCLESWDTPSAETHEKFLPGDINLNGGKNYDIVPNDDKLGLDNAKDGSTSHNSSNNVQEQPKVGSPPPIPKRSPSTRLSEQILDPFSFPSDNTSLDSYDSNRSDSAFHGDVLSDHVQISSLSPPKKNGDTPVRSIKKHTYGPDNCANCGRELKRLTHDMESTEDADIPSPFQQRKQMFETKIAEGSTNTPTPTGVNRSYGSSFRVRKTSPHVDTSSGPQSLPVNLSESGIESVTQLSNEISSNLSSVGDDSVVSLPGTHHAVNCSCREKILKLNEKFSATRQLLRLNSIDGLDSKPPAFVPPPPPIMNGISVHNNDNLIIQMEDGTGGVSRTNDDNSGTHRGKDSLQDSEADSFHSVNSSNESLRSADPCLEESLDSRKLISSSRLCNKCSSALAAHLAATIEDLPNLLPTDALNRPHLGLSYSMEDDLSPGVKEIQKTSTPKSDQSSGSLFKTKDSNLSTFSHSASSLGYVSSQSDLELNNLPTVPDKVPVSTFRSRTLPNGLDRSPFYSPVDEVFDRPYSPNEPKDHNGNRYLKPGHVSSEDLQLRSSSAPPPPEADKPKKKHFRFSRKDKKDKKKNDFTLQLNSKFCPTIMALEISFPDVLNSFSKVTVPYFGTSFSKVSVPYSTLQLPFIVLTSIIRRVLQEFIRCITTIANSLAILICYLYLKNFRRHSVIIVDGYITIFKTFAEFISAIACLCYGLMEVDILYTFVGIVGISMGLGLKALLLYNEHHPSSQLMRAATYGASASYIVCVLGCSFAFHNVTIAIGILPCASRIVTCIVPLVALSEFFRVSGALGKHFALLADVAAILVLWWYCAQLSLKYFVIVPSVVGLIFSFIQYVLIEIQKVASKEIETDLYSRQ
ncbi:uncharacterized protein TNIN_92741 [Trichonephila inaurata madagascariensis]|uniref:Uncharacterized protein n=1 Tax=Trichonephila inaurata madagascariensis TaxID=2747483 RepID=A0A8X6XV20_9ARAC|nr:uncharacterized protein TNIN_92741 [Trichonephila inaurata madagascariensis]